MLPEFIINVPLLPVATSVLTLLLAVVYYVWKDRNLPPGPKGLPYLGFWPFMEDSTCHLHLERLAKQYGDLFSVKVTGRLYVVINSIEALREVFITKANFFGKKVSGFSVSNMTFHNGVLFEHGEIWRVNRKFFEKAFREYGLVAVRHSLAGPVYDAANEVVEILSASKGEPVNISEILTWKCTNIIQRMILGGNGISKKQTEDFVREYWCVLQALINTSKMFLNGKIARYLILPLFPSFRNALKAQKVIEKILYDVVKEQEESFNEGCIRNIIDAYISERNILRKKGDPTAKYFTDEMLVLSLVQFLGDAIFTGPLFICSFLFDAAQHPEEQEKVYAELIEVLGSDRPPTLDDRAHLPYTKAFLYESSRVMDTLTFVVSLECTDETTLGGYRIPKGAVIMFNIWSVNHNPDTYQDPHVFNPSRFLSDSGKTGEKIPVTFGLGKRACLGEPLTMMQAFLFVATIIKEFRLKLDDNCDYEKLKLNPEEWTMCAIPRSYTD